MAEAQPMDTTQKEIVEMKTDIKSLQKKFDSCKKLLLVMMEGFKLLKIC